MPGCVAGFVGPQPQWGEWRQPPTHRFSVGFRLFLDQAMMRGQSISKSETMNLTLDMLTAFVRVAERLSITTAAYELGLAKSIVSKRLTQLEQALGAVLFARSTRRVSLTPAGQIYLAHARQLLADADAASEALRGLRTNLAGSIRVTAPVSWGHRVVGRLLPEFLAQHPALEIELLLEDRLMDLAQEGIDLALRMSARRSPDLVMVPLMRLDMVICAAPSYLAGAGAPKTPEDLANHLCLSYWRHVRHDRWDLQGEDRRVTLRVTSRYRANHPEAVADAATAGLGIALLPYVFVARALADGHLVQVLPAWSVETEFGDMVSAVALPDRLRLGRNQALLQFLKVRLEPPRPRPAGPGEGSAC